MLSKTPGSPASGLGGPIGLMCELLAHPESTVITNPRPSFGWIVNDGRRGAVQSAYQILVTSSESKLAEGKADLWDSGKVTSEQSVNVRHEGQTLPANSTCWWAVRTWDGDDEAGPWSTPQRINVGEASPDEPFYSERWVDVATDGSTDTVRANRHPLEVHRFPPVVTISKKPGHCFADFGRAAFGTLSVSLTSEVAGREVEIRLGEKRGAGDTVDANPGGSVVYRSVRLALKPGTHTYKLDLPVSNYGIRMPAHIGEVVPFRYCEIIGSPSLIRDEDLTQLAVFYKFDDQASSFASSNQALNDVWEMCKYSIKATSFLGIYVDGQRERLPYEADAFINQLGHYCVDREYAMARYSHEHLITHPTWPTEWILFSVLIAWEDYMYTGNLDSINRCYDDLVSKALIALEREDGLISTKTGLMTEDVMRSVHFTGHNQRDVVDWPQPSETDGYILTPINTVVNAFHYRALVLMGSIAELIGRSDEAVTFRERASRVRSAFNEKLFDPARGVYRDGEETEHASLHANMFALAFGLVDDERKASVVKFIKSRGMACSVYGAQFLLEALYRAGEDAAALELMTNRSDRSWPHMIYNIGSTVSLEAWDPKYKPNLDWNHAWGAAPANIIPRLLVGVEPVVPGFSVTRIRPQIGSLSDVSAEVPTIRGTVGVSIRRDGGEYRLQCQIPANMTAEVHLPASDPSLVTEGGHPAGKAKGVKCVGMDAGRTVFAVGAGEYEFSVRTAG